jgi:hypothetical protein
MAKIVTQTIQIQIHKLVKHDASDHTVCTSEQLLMLMETLPGVTEQILDDASLIVEVQDPDAE